MSAVRCRYAELLADNREFTEEEDKYFSEQAQHAYESFRDKAALSRGMQPEHMQQHAQVSQPASHLMCSCCLPLAYRLLSSTFTSILGHKGV